MLFTDSHCHLDFKEFTLNFNSLLQACNNAHIHQLIVPTIGPGNWDKVLTLSNKSSPQEKLSRENEKTQKKQCTIYTCLGIHPWFLNELDSKHLVLLANKVNLNIQQIIAIGETGIDGVIAKQQNNLDKQIAFFTYQLCLSQEYQLPVIIHHRQSHQYIVPLLKKNLPSRGGIIHAFSGSYQQAMQYIDLGFKIGIGGTITYPRAQKTIKAIQKIPLSSMGLETDAPSMPIYNHQGKNNSPLRIIDIFNCLVQIREEEKEQIATTIEKNIQQLFF